MALGNEKSIATRRTEWNPGFSINIKTCRSVGRPKKWEDEINDILKPEETEATKGNEIKNNDTWIKVANNREKWKEMGSEFTVAAAKTKGAYCVRGAGPSPRTRLSSIRWQTPTRKDKS